MKNQPVSIGINDKMTKAFFQTRCANLPRPFKTVTEMTPIEFKQWLEKRPLSSLLDIAELLQYEVDTVNSMIRTFPLLGKGGYESLSILSAKFAQVCLVIHEKQQN